MNFSEILANTKRSGSTLTSPIPQEWTQGRTAFGGLTTALAYYGARELTDETRALRGAMISFVGPTTNEVTIEATPLRSGRTTSSIRAEIKSNNISATEAIFTFADLRSDSKIHHSPPASPAPTSPVSDSSLEVMRPNFPQFYNNFEVSPFQGMPFSNAKQPDISWWVRHRDPAAHNSLEGLLSIGDALVPAYGTAMREWTPMSSMTWMINLLTDTATTEQGWWLLRSTSDSAGGGFTSQNMTIWNTSGDCVLMGRQMVTIFG
ncbi:thioesterase family protein [Hirschia litorea]|uniref:Thioesterase family protein n=1 Tax=Hirschia litorea TaxID=1199156 RepID=A0ABW2IKH1_9PROT